MFLSFSRAFDPRFLQFAPERKQDVFCNLLLHLLPVEFSRPGRVAALGFMMGPIPGQGPLKGSNGKCLLTKLLSEMNG